MSCPDKIYECKARGNFRKTGISPVVGDIVQISVSDSQHGVVEKIFERKNLLTRPSVANIDKLFIVSAYQLPSPDTLMIDRLTAIARFKGIEPVIVFNKCDMGDFEELRRVYLNSGFKTYVVCALSQLGTENIKSEIENCVCAFAGNSGVGKSSLLNAMFPDLKLKTNDVSQKLGRGKHTTRHTELFCAGGGYIADTPGFAAIDITDDTYEFKCSLADSFYDFSDYKDECKFNSCTHTCEKGCAVIEAVKAGKIEATRHESYKKIFEQLKDVKAWNV